MENKWNKFDLIKLKKYCMKNNMKIEINLNFISLKTNISNWIIYLSDNKKKVVLLHKNFYNNKNGVDFHLQKKYNRYKINKNGENYFDTYLLTKIASDVNKHDKKKFIQRKNKIQKLFDKINK